MMHDFNCALCDSIVHLTFQMRKVLVTKNSNQTSRHSLPGVWTAGHETNKFECCDPVAMATQPRPQATPRFYLGCEIKSGSGLGTRLMATVTTLLFAMQHVGQLPQETTFFALSAKGDLHATWVQKCWWVHAPSDPPTLLHTVLMPMKSALSYWCM